MVIIYQFQRHGCLKYSVVSIISSQTLVIRMNISNYNMISFQTDIASIIGVNSDRIQILMVIFGDVDIIKIKILPPIENNEIPANIAFEQLIEAIANFNSNLSHYNIISFSVEQQQQSITITGIQI